MSNQSSQTRFVILFALDPANERPAEGLALLHRLAGSGLGTGIAVLDQAFLPMCARVSLVLLVEAASKDSVLAALAPCSGVLTTVVEEPTSLTVDPAVPTATFAVLGIRTPHDDASRRDPSPDPSGGVKVRLDAQLPSGGDVSSITLVEAPTFVAAQSFGRSAVGSAVTETAQVQPLADYVHTVAAPAVAHDASERAAVPMATFAAAAATADPAALYTVTPLDTPLLGTVSDDLLPFSSGMALFVTPAGVSAAVRGRTYWWRGIQPDALRAHHRLGQRQQLLEDQ